MTRRTHTDRSAKRLLDSLIRTVNRTLYAEHEFEMRMTLANHAAVARRGRVVERTRARALRRVLETAGLSPADLEAHQRRDDAGFRKLAAKQQLIVKRHVAQAARRHANLLRDMQRLASGHFPEPTSVRLATAVSVHRTAQHMVWPTLPTVEVTKAKCRNLARIHAKISDDTVRQGTFIACNFHFAWKSDRDGSVAAKAIILPNLAYRIYLAPSCAERAARIRASAGLLVSVESVTAMPESELVALVDERASGMHSSGHLSVNAHTRPFALSSDFVNVKRDEQALFKVYLHVLLDAWSGELEFDCLTGEREINVAFVDLEVI